ncbi:hypothetical protein B0H16DRAFT_1510370 [Mycena metata]|uniref:MYND-type domain-containing protein n=1 Tax=Mycena metata TaxID=1033252 RepID=A0AAD7JXN7_9AGAR|nr:hypothetical protein B0H16DRAFT_1510370 [Mycena metata]
MPRPLDLPVALRLETLFRLPLSLRKIATSAAKGSLEHLDLLCRRARESPRTFELCLPAFYENLRPEDVPSVDQIDTDDVNDITATFDATSRAFKSLQAIYRGHHRDIDSKLFVHLWPRLWSWMQFVDSFPFCLPGGPSEGARCVSFLCHIYNLQYDEETALLIDSTPGVRILVARAWVFLLAPQNPWAGADVWREQGLLALADFLGRRALHSAIDPNAAPHIEELVEGAGGTIVDLARLVIKLMDLGLSGLSSPDDPPAPTERELLQPAILFLANPSHQPHLSAHVFLAYDILPVTMRAICAFNAAPFDHAHIIVSDSFDLIYWLLDTSPCQHWLAEAVRAGFLRAVASCGNRAAGITGEMKPTLLRIFASLTEGSIYYRTLSCIENALPDVESLVTTPPFTASPIAEHWALLMEILRRRLNLFRVYNTDTYYSAHACDNLACGKILKRADFKCCGTCRQRYYCSEICQRHDWQDGHRLACRPIHYASLNSPDSLTNRELSFFRAVIHDDYQSIKPDILFKQIEFMLANPGVDFYTEFDYTQAGGPAIKICPCGSEDDASVATRELMARATRSSGRMEMHRLRARANARRFACAMVAYARQHFDIAQCCSRSGAIAKRRRRRLSSGGTN